MIVVDASLATKWFFPERDSDDALAFLDRRPGQVAGPDLLLIEVASVIVRETNMAHATVGESQRTLNSWTNMWRDGEIRGNRITPPLIADAVEIATTIGHPISDCIYLALAIELGCELATSDVKFHNKASKIFRQVKLLSEF